MLNLVFLVTPTMGAVGRQHDLVRCLGPFIGEGEEIADLIEKPLLALLPADGSRRLRSSTSPAVSGVSKSPLETIKRNFHPAVAGFLATGPGAPTDRELEVLELVAAGLPYERIAQRLAVTERTVRFHLHNLRRKAGGVSRAELLQLARERGWIG